MPGDDLITVGSDIFSRVPADVIGSFWHTERSDASGRRVWLDESDQDHPLVKERSRSGFLTGSSASVALVDWSALHNVATLFDAPSDIRDPFTAILDLATVVAALVFYDRVVCLDYGSVCARVADHFALPNVLFGMDPGPSGHGPMHDMIEDYFDEAKIELQRAARDGESWLARLAANWEHLLPSVSYPHDFEYMFDIVHGGDYEHGFDVARDNLFELRESEYQFLGDQLGDALLQILMLDNDRRSLFYEILLEQIRVRWDPDRRMSFRYLSTCLRTPMKLARDEWAREQLAALKPAPEDWLQQEWTQLVTRAQGSVRLPFWLGAALANSRARGDFPSAVVALREEAEGFRRRRHELENALFEGDLDRLEKLSAALRGDLNKVTESAARRASGSLEVADSAFRVFLPVPMSQNQRLRS